MLSIWVTDKSVKKSAREDRQQSLSPEDLQAFEAMSWAP
jgi:hypothetical protein